MGLGLDPIFDAVPGAWNWTWLSAAPAIESLLSWSEDPGEFPCSLKAMPLSIASAMQQATEDKTYGELSLELTPLELIAFMRKKDPDVIINKFYGDNDIWLDLAEDNARTLYRPGVSAGNLIRADFRLKKVI